MLARATRATGTPMKPPCNDATDTPDSARQSIVSLLEEIRRDQEKKDLELAAKQQQLLEILAQYPQLNCRNANLIWRPVSGRT